MYKLIGTSLVKRLADEACIPFADGNKDYEEYKLWLSEGNTPEPEFTEEELAQKVLLIVEQEAEVLKVSTINNLTVTTESGKVFYANLESRVDLQSAIDSANLKGLTETPWKLAEEFEGSKIVIVLLAEIREALALALEVKGKLVGAINE